MFYFFCMSGDTEKDLIWPSLIVSGIACRLNEKQNLFVKEIPSFAAQYPNIKFNDNIPRALSKHRRAIHQDVLTDSDNVYLNVWPRHLREKFFQDGIKSAALQIAKCHMANLGTRKKVTLDHMLSQVGKGMSFTQDIDNNDKYSICLTKQYVDVFGHAGAATLMSSVSRAQFFSHPCLTNIKSSNFKPSCNDEFIERLSNANLIITTQLFTLLPFYNIARSKEIILLEDVDSDCKDLFLKHKTLGKQKLTRLISSFMK